MSSLLKVTLLIFFMGAPLFGASAKSSQVYCESNPATETLSERISCISQLVAHQSEAVLQMMGVASTVSVPTQNTHFTNAEFPILFDTERMRDGINPPRVRLERTTEPSVCADQLIHNNPIYYCTEDRALVININPDILDPEGFYGRTVALGRVAVACMIAHEMGHHLEEAMSINSYFVNIESDPDINRRMIYRGELFSDFFAGAFMSVAMRLPVFQRELGTIENWDSCNRVMEILGSDSTGIPLSERDHGTSEQRRSWFQRGVQSRGNIRFGDAYFPNFYDLLGVQ